MIRINLLPRLEIVEPKRRGELLIGLLAILAVIGVILVTHYGQKAKIKRVRNDISVAEKRINELQEIERRVNEFKAKNEEIKRRIQIIIDLENRRSGPLYVMDSLSTSIPDRAWIDEIKTKGGYATIKGIAWNEFTVADFLKALQESKFFKAVNVSVIEKENIRNLNLRSFEINTRLDYIGSNQQTGNNF